jgi:formate dehydrogenase major subunit/formate dehydrogenase alpha subunit
VETAPQDAQLMELAHGERIKVSSRRGEIEAVAQISSKAVNGTVFIPFHYAAAALDPICGIPEFKVCAVKIAKVA